MNTLNRWLLLFGICILSLNSLAQESSCIERLNRARESFDEGHLYDIPDMLNSCIDNGLNKGQRIQAYWLLTQTYLLIDDPEMAELSYLELLSLDPEYYIDEERDPIDVVYLSEKFTTTPIFILFGKLGVNFTQPTVIHNFGTDNTLTSPESYSAKAGINLAIGSEYNINDNFSLGLELQYANHSYTYTNSFFNNDLQILTERMTTVNVPVYLKYRYRLNKITPYAYVGFANNLILGSNAEVQLIDREGAIGNENSAEFTVSGPDISLTKQRSFYNYSLIGGLGANYRIGYRYVFLDVRYTYGLTNIVNIDNQYDNTELTYRYGYVDDYKRLTSLMISVGYIHPLYKPRKKSEKVGFLRQLFNKK